MFEQITNNLYKNKIINSYYVLTQNHYCSKSIVKRNLLIILNTFLKFISILYSIRCLILFSRLKLL